jgi:hypothetical protein
MTSRLKAETVERVEAVTDRQQHSKHFSAATDNDETTEDAVFYVWSAPRLYSEDYREKLVGSRELQVGDGSPWLAVRGPRC